jgi:hypothetical protein
VTFLRPIKENLPHFEGVLVDVLHVVAVLDTTKLARLQLLFGVNVVFVKYAQEFLIENDL